ncbi:MAG: CRISPR-associated helicase Cas3' [Nitrososphaerota archaeon]|nr:CRISPR-associated helicase Cas3' [Candidatus Bathyarchaeota archaeon]MDW8024198.1 CRISPR-associated helicase Cas3' [Nitrososphaerota archaeon]
MARKLPAFSCERFYSHPGIELKRHLSEVGNLCKEYVAKISNPRVREAAEVIGKCHDMAKYTVYFQKYLSGERVRGDLSTHSRLSAIFTSWMLKRRFDDPFLAAMGFLCVDSHHGDLKSFNILEGISPERLGDPVILEQVKSLKNNFPKVSAELGEIGLSETYDLILNFEAYLPEICQTLRVASASRLKLGDSEKWQSYYNTLMLFSALVDADKKDAGKVKTTQDLKKLPPDIVSKYVREKFASIGASKIDVLRSSIFSEVNNRVKDVVDVLKSGIAANVVTITAPTGTGKTLTGLHVALRLSEEFGSTRIVYCLPYINIIEQTHAVLEDVLFYYYGAKPDISMLLKHHHLFFPRYESEGVSLDRLLLLTDSWESKVVVTTFEQLLRSIIGCRNSLLKKLHNLAGSILILDEVQAIPLEYWRLVRDALLYLAEDLGVKIILMTATMPAIFKGKGVEVLSDPKKYFRDVNRTTLIPQLEKVVTAEEFADFFLSKWVMGTSALLVANTIRASKRIYKRLVESLGDEAVKVGRDPDNVIENSSKVVLAYLSTSVIPAERKKRIELLRKMLKERRSVILVSTQVVEAGVDLDFDVVFRDLGPLDSIVQVAGRCNRNWKLPEGKVYILRVVDEKGHEDSMKIYGRILPERTLEFIKASVKELELLELMERYYNDISCRMDVENDPKCMEILNKIKELDFQGLAGFTLIKEEPKLPIYIEYNADAKRLLQEFKATFTAIAEAIEKGEPLEKVLELKATLRKIRAEMENYIVEVYENEPSLRGLKPVMSQVNVLHVPSQDLPAYYDLEMGFRTAKDEESSFIFF